MKFILSWLKEFVPIELSAPDLAEKLTMAGLEVESIESIGESISGIITAKISSISPHPNADKLVITTVFDGQRNYQVVTGASNINEGDIVPLALPGSTIANGMTLKQVKLRGVDSFGMLCSEKELGVSEEATGIWICDPSTPIGVNFEDYALLKETILDIAILPNRGDCQSIYGLAREIAALTGTTLQDLSVKPTFSAINNPYNIEVDCPDLCPLYIGHYLTEINNHNPSPLWLQRRLQISGIRPISLIVDVTNYILLELGQPLHAFDANKLQSNTISVSTSTKAIKITTLDDQTRTVENNTLLIYDGNQPIAIGGVMGGQSSAVDLDTTHIVLESAYFDPRSIRKSALQLGCRTDSAIRFEKGINIDTVDIAAKKAACLIQEWGHAKISKTTVSFKQPHHSRFNSRSLSFEPDKINSFLGSSFSAVQMQNILSALGFTCHDKMIEIPIWRVHDIHAMPCLAEEIARVIGFDHIPSTLPHTNLVQEKPLPSIQFLDSWIPFWVNQGFTQANTYPMISIQEFIHSVNHEPSAAQELQNPISPQLAVMRPVLLPSLLKLVQYHLSRQTTDLQFFCCDKVFPSEYTTQEPFHFAAVSIGSAFENASSSTHHTISKDLLMILQGKLKTCFDQLGYTIKFKQSDQPLWSHPHQWQSLYYGKHYLGSLGLVHPSHLTFYDITAPVCYVEFNLSPLIESQKQAPVYRPFSRYPSTRRDVALLVPKSLPFAEIEQVINQFKHKTLHRYFVFDCFESDQLGTDHKSIAIGFIYQDLQGTLADDKINQIHERLCHRLQTECQVSIR